MPQSRSLFVLASAPLRQAAAIGLLALPGLASGAAEDATAPRAAAPRATAAGAENSPSPMTPVPPAAEPLLGYRYGGLTSHEAASLRRSFKLPMEVLFAAETPIDLARRAVVQPLPDPAKPLLPVGESAPAGTDPFRADAAKSPLEARLGALAAIVIEAESAAVSGAGPAAPGAPAPDPFAADPFEAGGESGGPSTAEPTETAQPAGEEDIDPFSDAGF